MASLHAQFDGSSSSSVFSGSAFNPPTQSPQIPDPSSSPSKGRGSQGAIPLTVRQIAEAYASTEDKSNLTINGVDITSVNLLGMVMNKLENVTDVSFTLDDGTGRIGICRWVNETSDVSEAAAIRNGIYVKVNCHMKGFQGKKLAFAFSVRPVTNFNDIVLHYIECVYIHMEIIRMKVARPFPAQIQTNLTVGTPFPTGVAVYKAYTTSQLSGYSGIDGTRNDIYNMVLAVFQEPAVLSPAPPARPRPAFRCPWRSLSGCPLLLGFPPCFLDILLAFFKVPLFQKEVQQTKNLMNGYMEE